MTNIRTSTLAAELGSVHATALQLLELNHNNPGDEELLEEKRLVIRSLWWGLNLFLSVAQSLERIADSSERRR